MSISVAEHLAIVQLARLFNSFLPWSGHTGWKGHVSFQTVAVKAGVGDFWTSGSKQPMMVALLEQTVARRRDRFEDLILGIVRAGITYRDKNGSPITRAEIEELNRILVVLRFKFRELWDEAFLASLSASDEGDDRGTAGHVEHAGSEERNRHSRVLAELRAEFLTLHDQQDRQAAGYSLESILARIFEVSGLAPRRPFRVTGEQIDGSFELDHDVYLLEAKWEKGRQDEAALLTFRGKVEGKSTFTRGVFVAVNGVTEQARTAITRGKQPNFFVVDGHDLLMVLSEDIALDAFLRQRVRLLAEEGLVCVAYSDLWDGSRAR